MIEYIKLYYMIMGSLFVASLIILMFTYNEVVEKICLATLSGMLSPIIGLFMAIVVVVLVLVIVTLPITIPIGVILDKKE